MDGITHEFFILNSCIPAVLPESQTLYPQADGFMVTRHFHLLFAWVETHCGDLFVYWIIAFQTQRTQQDESEHLVCQLKYSL